MGQTTSRPEFLILNSNEAAEQLRENDKLDNYNTACAHCRVNRMAAQRVEPCAAPPGAQAAIDAVNLPSWLAADLRERQIKVAFFHEGLPHTREPDTIWLPVSIPDFETTFIHECIHISQRLWPDKWTAAYETIFNMRPRTSIPRDLDARRRFNPDTFTSTHYTWTAPSGAKWTPVLVFMRPDTPNIRAVRLLFMNDDEGWQSAVPTEWMRTFRTDEPSICEHPHEMAAYMLTSGGVNNFKIAELTKYLERNSRSSS